MTDMHALPPATRELGKWQVRLVISFAILIGTGLAVYAAAASYESVSGAAAAHSVPLPYLNPLGLDGGLFGVIALNIALTWMRCPIWWLRLVARLFAVGTIAANAAAGWPDPIGIGLRVAAPALFVVMAEVGSAVLVRRNRAERIGDEFGIPAGRWAANPFTAFGLWRRKHLLAVTSWPLMNAIEDARTYLRDSVAAVKAKRLDLPVPLSVRRAMRSGRFPGEVRAAIEQGLESTGAAHWEPVMGTWLTSRLGLPEALSDAISNAPQAAPETVTQAAPETPAQDTSPEDSQGSTEKTSRGTSRKPTRTQVKRMSPEQLAPHVLAMLEERGDVSRKQVMDEFHVGEPKAKEALRIARLPRPVGDSMQALAN